MQTPAPGLRPGLCRVAATCAAVLSAASAAAQQPFTEEALARGVDYFVFHGSPNLSFGTGLAFCDLDADGDPDLVVTGASTGFVGLYENDGTGQFTARGPRGIPAIANTSGVTAADYDGDGLLDLYFSCTLAPNRLARNLGDWTFVELGAAAGVDDAGAGMGCAWGDYDGDGDLDLYLANRTGTQSDPTENKLYRNEGDGTFVDVAAALGVVDAGGLTFQAIFLDCDRDGDADLYLSTDKGNTAGQENHLYRNDGGTFTDVTDAVVAANFDSMGVAVGDVDGNGLFDLYCTNTPGGNGLFMQQTPFQFSDATDQAGIAVNELGWAAVFFDVDNDTTQDLYVCNELNLDVLFENDGFPFVDRTVEYQMTGDLRAFCCAKADVDGDGDVDLAVSNWLQPIRLYINHEGEQRSWIRLAVSGKAPNHHAVGATVSVRTGSLRQIGEVMVGSNYKSQNELTLHFGLDSARFADQVDVRWPDGETRTLRNLPSAATWTLHHDAELGDADGDGALTYDDFLAFRDCWTGPGPGNLRPGCEVLDMDGDGDVDGYDMREFILRFDDYQQGAMDPVF